MEQSVNYFINDYLTLRIEGKETIIYVKEKKFRQCKKLIITIPKNNKNIKSIDSIDEITDDLGYLTAQNSDREELGLTPELEFLAHASNLQAWYENNYNTKFLHSNLSFPLLKKLVEARLSYVILTNLNNFRTLSNFLFKR